MEIFLTIFYLLVFCFIIYRLRFFEIPLFPKKFIIAIFVLKALAAVAFGLIHRHFYGEIDTFTYFNDSRGVYRVLFIHPWHFLQILFSAYDNSPSETYLPTHISYYLDQFNIVNWSSQYDSEFVVVRFLAIFNIFTFAHYYADSVFMAFISLIGALYVYRLLISSYPEKAFLFKIALFGVPTVVFFTSGIHKEALSLFFLGILLWNFNRIIEGDIRLKRLIILFIAAYLLYVLRDFVFVFLFPNLVAYYLCMKKREKVFLKFLFTHLIYWGVLFNLFRVNERWDIIQKIVWKQEDFSGLEGNSNIELNKLEPEFFSLVKNTPQALQNTLLRPFFGEARTLFQKLASVEAGAVALLLFLCLLFNNIRRPMIHPALPFCLLFSVSILIILGLIVPNLGALARYKSNVLAFLLASFFMMADEKKVFEKLKSWLKIYPGRTN